MKIRALCSVSAGLTPTRAQVIWHISRFPKLNSSCSSQRVCCEKHSPSSCVSHALPALRSPTLQAVQRARRLPMDARIVRHHWRIPARCRHWLWQPGAILGLRQPRRAVGITVFSPARLRACLRPHLDDSLGF
eukprot:1577313-Pleurochrysis_carterae.AAC.4